MDILRYNPDTKRKIKLNGEVYQSLIAKGYTDEQLKTPTYVVGHVSNESNVILEHDFEENANEEIANRSKVFQKINIASRDELQAINDSKVSLHNIIHNYLFEKNSIKVQLTILNHYIKHDEITGEIVDNEEKGYFSGYISVTRSTDINDVIDQCRDKIFNDIETRPLTKSGWVLNKIVLLEIKMTEYNPASASSYFPTPEDIPQKSVINVKNDDNMCFKWAILSCLHEPSHHPDRVAHYKKFDNELNFTNIEFPVSEKDYYKFEKNNSTINLWVFGYSDGLFHIYVSQFEKRENRIGILLLEKDDKKHYVWIKKIDRLVAVTAHNMGATYHVCWKCLNGFKSDQSLQEHEKNCSATSSLRFPTKGYDTCEFNNWKTMQPKPFWITLDFEAFNQPLVYTKDENKQSSKIMSQEANSFAYVIMQASYYSKTYNDIPKQADEVDMTYETKPLRLRLYRGEDVYKTFFETLDKDIASLLEKLEKPLPYNKTETGKQLFYKSTACYLCNKPFNKNYKDENRDKRLDKVTDHCHLTGRIRGICHQNCNTKMRWYKKTIEIPIVVHNLRGYDSHLIFKGLSQLENKYRITLIPNNIEKYMSFTLNNMRFIDSFQFVAKPLSDLIDEIKGKDDKAMHDPDKLAQLFPVTANYFDKNSLDYVTEKGVYPYEYTKSFDDFTSGFPAKEEFDRNHLRGADISQEEYDFAKEVYEKFECKNFGDYHNLYLKTDVLLLADYWANFCRMCLEQYRIDPNHYFSAAGMAFDAALLKTDAKLELLKDVDMYHFIRKGMRGGMSQACQQYAKANNEHCRDYDPNKDKTWLCYFDATALYSWAMMQCLPTGGHEFCDNVSIDEILATADDAPKGYLVKCKLVVPKEKHDYFSDYPPCPELGSVNENWLSPHQKKLLTDNKIKLPKSEKLLLTLCAKDEYVIHYRLLKLYVNLGVKIDKVYQVVSFDQSPWLKNYIELNNALRKRAKEQGIDSLVELAKLFNNAFFGKTMENVENRINVQILQLDDQSPAFLKKASSSKFLDYNKISDKMCAVHMRKTNVYLNKPIFVGQSILDISKCLMYDFYYNVLKSKYNDNMRLIYTDTDSLIIEFKTENIYCDLALIKDKFDMSDIKKDSPYYKLLHHTDCVKVPGKFKPEEAGIPIAEVVCLKAKMYSFLMTDYKDSYKNRHAKGIKKNNIKKDLRHQLYKDCLFESKMDMTVTQYNIESEKHELGLYENVKSSITAFDDKKYIIDHGLNSDSRFESVTYGHYKIL